MFSQCAICRSWPSEQACGSCLTRFSVNPPRCKTCALALPTDLSQGLRTGAEHCIGCIRQPPPLDETFAAVSYAYPWSQLVASFKFGAQPGWARFLASRVLLAPGLSDLLHGMQPSDWVIPMPLASRRLQERGFNQAWQLARELGSLSRTAARPDAGLLLRLRDTLPQSDLGRDKREANVQGAFAVDPLRAAELRGRHALLVDDVMTSGASLFAAARVLRQAGAARITAAVFARTEND